MKSLKLVNLFVVALLLMVSCNKEDMNKKSAEEENARQVVVPAPCKVGEGTFMSPAPILPEELAAVEATKADQVYTIPVVFHVFGTSHADGGGTRSGVMDAARFEKVLTWINNDFNGEKNPGDLQYFGNINADRKEFVDFLPIKFVLAKYGPDGTKLEDGQKFYKGKISTDGNANAGKISGGVSVIIYSASHPLAKIGPGNELWEKAMLATQIKNVAWNNKMYMNVYITNDLEADGIKYRSGIAWYPDAVMTNANTARVVYNGTYLPGNNGEKDFTSVISHEFGHFLNLPHTFDGGCVQGTADSYTEGDFCKDTPQMENSSENNAYKGHGKKNCNGDVIDYGNFMNYGVYSNFTKDQVKRMKAALQHVARKPLWQQSNLDKVLGNGFRDPATFDEKLQDINNKLGK